MNQSEMTFEEICGQLDYLSDKGLTNLITVIRTVQTERESELIEASTVS